MTSILFAGKDLGSFSSSSSPATRSSPGVDLADLDLLGVSSSLPVSEGADGGFLGGKPGLFSFALPSATRASPEGVLVDELAVTLTLFELGDAFLSFDA